MVDVVFLLLVFFMLAARFDTELTVALSQPGDAADYEGPPRLVEVYSDRLELNGILLTPAQLSEALRPLMPSESAVVLMRPRGDADVQRVVETLNLLARGGIANVVLVEGG